MTLRENFRRWRRTRWGGGPVGDFVLESSPVPPRPFAIVSASFPRRRAWKIKRGEAVDPAEAEREDAAANAALAELIAKEGRVGLPCVGADPDGPHREVSCWVWDATPAQAMEWGRSYDQAAVLLGDGTRCGLAACFPEDEPATPPDLVLLLHDKGDSGEGAPALLERELRARGWDQVTFLRPTFASPGEFAGGSAAPILTVGFGQAGLLAARSDAPWRIGVGTPWKELAGSSALSWPGLLALHGGSDPSMQEQLAILPPRTLRLVDPEAGQDPKAWIGRIADGVMRLWNVHDRPQAALAAGWQTPGFAPPRIHQAPDPNTGRAVVVAGMITIWGAVLVSALCVLGAVLGADTDPLAMPLGFSLAALCLYGGVVVSGIVFYIAQRVTRSRAAVPQRAHLGAAAITTSVLILIVVESLALWMAAEDRAPPFPFHGVVFGGAMLLALIGLGLISVRRSLRQSAT